MTEIAVVSESTADEAGLLALASGVLGRPCLRTPELVFRSRGYPAVLRQIHTAVAAIAYRTRPVALLVVVDGNGSSMEPNHPTNRLEAVRKAAEDAQRILTRAGQRVPILCGVAYPAIDAWWLSTADPTISEQSWAQRGRPGGAAYQTAGLKRQLYGTRRSLTEMEQRQAEAAAFAVTHVDLLARRFPLGFAPLLAGLRALSAETPGPT